jgi:hypothetical protein
MRVPNRFAVRCFLERRSRGICTVSDAISGQFAALKQTNPKKIPLRELLFVNTYRVMGVLARPSTFESSRAQMFEPHDPARVAFLCGYRVRRANDERFGVGERLH